MEGGYYIYADNVNVVKQRVLLVSTSAADLIHYRRKKFGQIRAGGLRVANSVWILSILLHQQIRGPVPLHLDVVGGDEKERTKVTFALLRLMVGFS